MKRFKLNKKGVTLIELVLVIAIIGIITQVIFSIYFVGNKSFAISNNIGFSQQGVRLATDFINSELKYLYGILEQAQVVDKTVNTDYYSLSLEDNDDGSKDLVRTKYHADGTDVSQKTITGNWESIKIKNNKHGIIDLVVKQSEGKLNNKSGYELTYEINLVNNRTILTGLDIELSDKDKIYYTLAEDNNITASIDPPVLENGGDGTGGNPPDIPNPPDTTTYGPIVIDLTSIKDSNGESLNKHSNGDYIIRPDTEFFINIEISGVSNDYKVTLGELNFEHNNNVAVIKYTSPSSTTNGKFTLTIMVKDNKNNRSEKGRIMNLKFRLEESPKK